MKNATRPEVVPDDVPRRARLSEGASDAYHVIKRCIIELDLPPSTSFTEQGLAARLHLSARAVHEAVFRLRDEGFVESAGRSGYRVAPVAFKDAHDLFRVRTLLEAESAAAAAERGSDLEALAELDRLARERFEVTDRDDVIRFIRHNTRFHVKLAEFAGNQFLATMLEQTLEQLERVLLLGLEARPQGDELVHDHVELLAAVKGGNPDAARAVAIGQAGSSRLMVVDAFLSGDAWFTANLAAVPV